MTTGHEYGNTENPLYPAQVAAQIAAEEAVAPVPAPLRLLSAADILRAQDITTEDVAVPEWGGTVRVKALSAGERDAFEASLLEGKGKQQKTNLANVRAKFVARVLVNEQGVRLFTDADVQQLGRKSAAALERVFDVGRRLSGMSDQDVEDLTGNSEPDQSGASSSA